MRAGAFFPSRHPGKQSCLGIRKAADFDSTMRRFESSRPSQNIALQVVCFREPPPGIADVPRTF
jgi:hypothetical protein